MDVDVGLVERSRAGDKAAFAELYELVQNDMYKFALYTLGNREDAEDAVADTFVDAFRGISKLREPAAFKGWMFRILSIRCKKAVGGYIKRKNTFDIEDFLDTAALPSENVEADAAENVTLVKALGELSSDERMIISLSALHGYTTKEISDIIGKPQGTVGSKLNRSYKKLREMIGG